MNGWGGWRHKSTPAHTDIQGSHMWTERQINARHLFFGAKRKRGHVSLNVLVQAYAHMDVCVCPLHVSFLLVHPSQLAPPPTETSPACASIPAECRAVPSDPLPSKTPRPQRQRKEQESLEMNGQPGASWQELNGNVKLATDPLCLCVEGPVSQGNPNRIIPSLWQSIPHCFHLVSLCCV